MDGRHSYAQRSGVERQYDVHRGCCGRPRRILQSSVIGSRRQYGAESRIPGQPAIHPRRADGRRCYVRRGIECLGHPWISCNGADSLMPQRAPRFCAAGHAAFTERRCPVCVAAYEARRGTAADRGYGGRWRGARQSFLAAHPLCRCGAQATVVDHIRAHRGDQRLFWDRSNWQPMCATCHGVKTRTIDAPLIVYGVA
jgi:5-methylcytosine-specific restriction protein A